MTLKRFHQKLQAYSAYWREKKQQDKFGIKHFRVLTVTQSHQRQENLVSGVEADEDLRALARMFLFTSEEKFRLEHPESIFEPVWSISAGAAPISL